MEELKINAIEEDGFIRPERELTDLEKQRVVSTMSNGLEYIYFLQPEVLEESEEDNNDLTINDL